MTQAEMDELRKERATDNGNTPKSPMVTANHVVSTGLTKREDMATKILSGLLANSNISNYNDTVTLAVSLTDKLLIELNKR